MDTESETLRRWFPDMEVKSEESLISEQPNASSLSPKSLEPEMLPNVRMADKFFRENSTGPSGPYGVSLKDPLERMHIANEWTPKEAETERRAAASVAYDLNLHPNEANFLFSRVATSQVNPASPEQTEKYREGIRRMLVDRFGGDDGVQQVADVRAFLKSQQGRRLGEWLDRSGAGDEPAIVSMLLDKVAEAKRSGRWKP